MARFTDTEYKALLATMVAADTDPVLTPAELDLLLKLHRIVDEAGLGPSDTGWAPTYDLKGATLEGLRWKLRKATDLSVARTGDLTLEDNAIVRNLEIAINDARRGMFGAVQIPVSGVTTGDTAIEEED